jgi:hypothetical protein
MNDDDVHITCKDMLGPSESTILQHFLSQQRAAVLAIIDGLSEEQLRQPVLPSGWTPIGMIKHLGGAELHWIQQVFQGEDGAYDWPDGVDEPYDPDAPFTTDHETTAVIDFYRRQAAVTDEVLAAAKDLYVWPQALQLHPLPDEPPMQLRWIIVHLIEETARHAGHLDAARELLDGRTGLGPR